MPIGFILIRDDSLNDMKLIGFFQSADTVNEAIYRDYEHLFDYLHDFDITTSISDYGAPTENDWIPMDFQKVTEYQGVTAGFEFCEYRMVDYIIYLVGTEQMTGASCLS